MATTTYANDADHKLGAMLPALAQGMSQVLDEKSGGHVIFVLVVQAEGGGATQYVANGNRDDCLKVLREILDRLGDGSIGPALGRS